MIALATAAVLRKMTKRKLPRTVPAAGKRKAAPAVKAKAVQIQPDCQLSIVNFQLLIIPRLDRFHHHVVIFLDAKGESCISLKISMERGS